MKLRNKIVLSIILCILIGIVPILYLVQTTVRENNYAKVHSQTKLLLDSKAKEVGSWLNQRISELRIIKENDISRNLDYDKIQDYILNLNKTANINYGNIKETFAIGGLDGKGFVSSDITIDVSSRNYFKEIILGDKEYSISEPLISKSDNKPIFIISTAILNYNNKKTGFINGAVPLKKLTEITESIEFDNGFMWIMNDEYDAYTIDNTLLYKNHLKEDELKSVDFKNLNMQNGSVKLINAKGEKSTLFYSKVPYTENWILCNLINDDILYKYTNQIIRYITLYAVILIFAALVAAIIISKSITNPMEKLKQNMIKISKGSTDIDYDLNSKDEVQVLADVFFDMLDDLEKSADKRNLLEKEKRDAEFKTLQSQINPHFLYNTLDTISWKALEYDDKEVYKMVSSLSDFFRISLSEGEDFISLKDEVKHVKSYLDIQKIRYKNKLDFNIYLDPSLSNALIVKMILQPLVENSIFHGLKEKRYVGEIKISILKSKEFININILDNGIGIDEKKLHIINKKIKTNSYSDSYGLFNINERLRLIYGEKYSLKIKSSQGKYTLVNIKIPLVKKTI